MTTEDIDNYDKILETLDGVPFLYTIDRHPRYQEVKAKLEAHQKRMVLEGKIAELERQFLVTPRDSIKYRIIELKGEQDD